MKVTTIIFSALAVLGAAAPAPDADLETRACRKAGETCYATPMCCPGLGCVLWDGVGFCAREDLEKRATPMGEDLDKRAAPMSEDLDKRAAPMSEDLDKRAAPENNDPEMVKKRIDYAEYCKKNGIHLSEFKGTAPVTPRASEPLLDKRFCVSGPACKKAGNTCWEPIMCCCGLTCVLDPWAASAGFCAVA